MDAMTAAGCSLPNVVAFIHAHVVDATTLGALLQVPASYVLGLSGWESQWGSNRFAVAGDNFFSLHGGKMKPFDVGEIRAAGGKNPLLSTFPSYPASGQSFIAQYGSFLRAAASSQAFAQGLIRSGFNSGKSGTGGAGNFAANTVTGIAMVEQRRAC